jgi:hypothetical protein
VVIYQILRAINEWYALMVLWVYVAALLFALSLIFVFPPAVILLVFIGLGGMGVAVLVAKALRGGQHLAARHALSRGVCPRCRVADQRFVDRTATWRCECCGAAFEPTGRQIVVAEMESPGTASPGSES